MAWPFRTRTRDALTASVHQVELDNGKLRPRRSKDASWQTEAWLMAHALGEARFCARYMGNTLSRVRFFVGTRDHPGDPVIPIPDDTKNKDDLQYRDLLERIKGRDGTFASLVRVYGIQQFIAGESWLVGETGLEAETWEFLSTSEIRRIEKNAQAGMSGLGDDPMYERDTKGDGNYTQIGAESLVLRFWTRDAEYRERADSPLRSVLDICQALLTAQQMQTAGDMSRLATMGLLLVPAEAELPKVPLTDTPGHPAQQPRLMLMDSLLRAMETAMEQPGTVAAISPILVEVKEQYIKSFTRLTFDREVDKTIVARIDHLIRRFAQGVDLPPEKLLGIGDLNHWSAWNVSEETISAHISPMAAAFCEDLTVGYLHPVMETMKVDDLDRYAIGFDPTDLIVSPDRANHAINLYEKYELGGDHLLEALGFDPAVRPDLDEIIRRILIARAANPRNPDPGPDLLALQGKAPVPTGAEKPVMGDPNAPVNPRVGEPPTTDRGEDRAPPDSADSIAGPGLKQGGGGAKGGAKGGSGAKGGGTKGGGAKGAPARGKTSGGPSSGQSGKNTGQAPPSRGTSKTSAMERMVLAIDNAVDQALYTGTEKVVTPEVWRPLRELLAREGFLDLEVSARLIDGVMLLARNKRLNPGMDVLGAARVLCEAALWDEDDLDPDDDRAAVLVPDIEPV